MSQLIDMMIGGEVLGHQQDAFNMGYAYEPHANILPDAGPGVDMTVLMAARGYPDGEARSTIDQMIDHEVVGNTGASLDGYTPVDYRANRPGFGGFNDQPMQSGPTNMGGKSVPSEEAGTGKPWGPIAHMPVAMGANRTRMNYSYEGVLRDGQMLVLDGVVTDPQRPTRRAAAWTSALFGRQQDPRNKIISQWIGSTVMEVPPTMSLAEALGRFTDDHGPSWGIQ